MQWSRTAQHYVSWAIFQVAKKMTTENLVKVLPFKRVGGLQCIWKKRKKSRESLAFQTSRWTSMRLKEKPPKLLTEANPKAAINFRQWEGSCCHSFKKSVDSETVSAPYFHFSRKHKMNDYSFHNLISFPSLNVSDNELISIWKIRSIQLHVAPLPITLIWLFTRM